MLTYIPHLILPQRLQTITLVEISWQLKACYVEDELDKADLDENHLNINLELLSKLQFLALRCLYLSLEDSDQASFAIHAEDEYIEAILKHLDPFVQRMYYLDECALALQDLFFELIYDDAAFVLSQDDGSGSCLKSFRQIWRCPDGNITVVQLLYVDSYLALPYQLLQVETQPTGYWIVEESNREVSIDSVRGSCVPEDLRGMIFM